MINQAAVLLAAYRLGVQHGGEIELFGVGQSGETGQPTLTDAERDDLRVWLTECRRQASAATEGCNEELAERWLGRSRRAAALLERLGGDHAH